MSDVGYRLRAFWYAHFSRGSVLTTLIIASNIAVFLLQLVWFYWYRSAWFDETFALSHDGLARGAYWQWITYAWLHSETLLFLGIPIHIVFNMLMVHSLGREVEWPLGPARYLALYFGSLLAAAGVWLLFDRTAEGIEGASGAVFGLLAAFGLIYPRRILRVWLLFVIPIQMSARTLAVLLIVVEVVCQAQGWLPSIGHLAHLGGALFGLVFTLIWKRRQPPVRPVVVGQPGPGSGHTAPRSGNN